MNGLDGNYEYIGIDLRCCSGTGEIGLKGALNNRGWGSKIWVKAKDNRDIGSTASYSIKSIETASRLLL